MSVCFIIAQQISFDVTINTYSADELRPHYPTDYNPVEWLADTSLLVNFYIA